MSLNHILTGGVSPLQDISVDAITANSASIVSQTLTSLTVTGTSSLQGAVTCGSSLSVASVASIGSAVATTTQLFVSNSNQSYLVAPFGDFGQNGTVQFRDGTIPQKRLAMGYDPVNDVSVIQSIQASVALRPLYLNPSGGVVGVGGGGLDFLSDGSTSVLNHYEESTFAVTYSGIWAANQIGNIKAVRVGDQVILSIDAISAAENAAATITAAAGSIPASFRPSKLCKLPLYVEDNSVGVMGAVNLATDGSMTFFVGASGNFANAGNGGIISSELAYNTA